MEYFGMFINRFDLVIKKGVLCLLSTLIIHHHNWIAILLSVFEQSNNNVLFPSVTFGNISLLVKFHVCAEV